MLSEVKTGQVWRRKSDGRTVIIEGVWHDYGGHKGLTDIRWKRTDVSKRGAIFEDAFLKQYVFVEVPDVDWR